ncbi:hypothetical protein M426DRAFT_325848 [Hypoxylon sp. CI-4A]|nr:hypothetical protein M426DRAFT_325848 [Hypoxylon sp. CI-4A]
MSRVRSDTHTTVLESARRPSLWAGSLRRDHIRLDDLPNEEGVPYTSSKSGPSSNSRRSFAWPFHGRNTSEAYSTTRSSHFTFRTFQPRGFFRPHSDAASIDRSIVPDYVVNFLRGETPETLARKKEQRKWGQHGVEVTTPRRETMASQPLEFGNYYSSSSGLGRDLNTFSSWSRQSGIRRHITGWRGGIIFNSLLSFLILVVGIICLILVIAKARLLAGESAIFSGDCTKAQHINVGIHIVINVFGVALLSGANYVFQVLSSPTRRETVVAHGNKHWLDIGIPSIRNFAHISGFRAAVAVIVLLSAAATQVIYNAVIFTTQNVTNYDVLFVSQSFLDHAPFDNTDNEGGLSNHDIINLQNAASQDGVLTNLSSSTCLQDFSGIFQPSFDAVLLITDTVSKTSSLIHTSQPVTSLTTFASNNDEEITAPDGSNVQYCLARPSAPQTCSVNLSGSILGIAVLLNLAAVISMAIILARSSFEPLVTLGDSIRSFLRHPDPTTANACLLAKSDVQQGRWTFNEPQFYTPKNHYWFQTPSLPRWALTVFSWLAIAAPTAVALGLLLQRDPGHALTLFGVAMPQFSFLPPSAFGTAQMALVTALPQLLLGILYFAVNSHLTVYFLSHEFSLFSLRSQPLRVSSSAAGEQTTSLYLTLPRPVSWALLVWFAGMGFSLSQAVFPGVVSFSPSKPVPTADIVAVSFSTQALAALLALLVILFLAVLGLGFRRAPVAPLATAEAKGNPLILRSGACSAVISAKCHNHDIVAPGRNHAQANDGDLWLRSISWGVVEEGAGMRPGRCGFSAGGPGYLDVGRNYV